MSRLAHTVPEDQLTGAVASWLRHRFNECLEKIEWAKDRCADELPFVDRMIHDKAKEYVSGPLSGRCS